MKVHPNRMFSPGFISISLSLATIAAFLTHCFISDSRKAHQWESHSQDASPASPESGYLIATPAPAEHDSLQRLEQFSARLNDIFRHPNVLESIAESAIPPTRTPESVQTVVLNDTLRVLILGLPSATDEWTFANALTHYIRNQHVRAPGVSLIAQHDEITPTRP